MKSNATSTEIGPTLQPTKQYLPTPWNRVLLEKLKSKLIRLKFLSISNRFVDRVA